jgi:hypothetical protein
LQELTLFQYIQITGGNKYREGYQYKITHLDSTNTLKNSIEKALQNTLEAIKIEYSTCTERSRSETVGQNPLTDTKPATTQAKNSRTAKS